MLKNVLFSKYFSDRRERIIFLLDTDILADIAQGGSSQKISHDLRSRGIVLVFALPSIMELGFGSNEQAKPEEIKLYTDMYKSTVINPYHTMELRSELRENYDAFRGSLIGVSPDPNDWFAAKKALVQYLNESGAKPDNAKKMQFDALLYCTAWNLGGFLWSNNVKDHAMVGYYLKRMRYHHLQNSKELIASEIMPVFTTKALEEIIAGKKVNIYENMMECVSSEVIHEVLQIAINKYLL